MNHLFVFWTCYYLLFLVVAKKKVVVAFLFFQLLEPKYFSHEFDTETLYSYNKSYTSYVDNLSQLGSHNLGNLFLLHHSSSSRIPTSTPHDHLHNNNPHPAFQQQIQLNLICTIYIERAVQQIVLQFRCYMVLQ